MAIHRYLDASTSHITEEDSQMLTVQAAADREGSFAIKHRAPLLCEYAEGFFFHNRYDDLSLEEARKEISKAGYSKSLSDVLEYAFLTLSVDYLRLDSDGDTIEGFNVHQW